MKDKNICKFIPDAFGSELNIICFVYESNMETIRNKIYEKSHRAILIKNGNGSFYFDGRELEFSTGDLIFAFSRENTYVESELCEYTYISFDGSRSEELFRRFGISKGNRLFKGHDGMIPLWQESLSRASENNIDLTAEGMLLYAFSRLVKADNEQNKIINTIMEMTEECFSDPELSLTVIGERLSYSPKYLSHYFKTRTGMNYSEYLKNIRIKYAVTLIDSGVDSVKNVAALSGFSDPLYFSSVFKKTVGVAPKEYKKK